MAAAALVAPISSFSTVNKSKQIITAADKLTSITVDVVPITVKEREGRLEKAQRLLTGQKIKTISAALM